MIGCRCSCGSGRKCSGGDCGGSGCRCSGAMGVIWHVARLHNSLHVHRLTISRAASANTSLNT